MSGIGVQKIAIIEYYDSLIRQLDIYVEETFEKMNNFDLIVNNQINNLKNEDSEEIDFSYKSLFDVNQANYNGNFKYDIKMVDIMFTGSKKVDYFNWVRHRSINELKRVQKNSLETLRIHQPSCGFCFLLKINKNSQFYLEFEVVTIILDFKVELDQKDLNFLEYNLIK